MSYESQVDYSKESPPDDSEGLFDYAYEQPGSIPGTLKIQKDADLPEIILIDDNSDLAERISNLTPESCTEHLDTESVSWVDVKGLGSKNILQS